MNKDLAKRIVTLRDRIVANFVAGDWEEVGLLTGYSQFIKGHPRLLRSLSWGDEDYAGNVLSVLDTIANLDTGALDQFDSLLARKYPEETQFISAKPSDKKLTFAPHVFEIQDVALESDLVALMMPFGAEFKPAHFAIKAACEAAKFRCLRADDIWEESAIML